MKLFIESVFTVHGCGPKSEDHRQWCLEAREVPDQNRALISRSEKVFVNSPRELEESKSSRYRRQTAGE